MTIRTPLLTCLLILAAGLAACNDAGMSPTAPSPPTQPNVRPPASSGGDSLRAGVTLFGVVFETTPAGQVPIADVHVYCDACGEFGHTSLRTDANGYYSFSGDLSSGGGIWLATLSIPISVVKEGYEDPPGLPPSPGLPVGAGWRNVTVNGDTRFDVQLVRR